MNSRLATDVIPLLVHADEEAFNAFRVLHHGTHEKQLSNLFAWLLKPSGSHGLGDLGALTFMELVQAQSPGIDLGQLGTATVFQEVGVRERKDIADILLLAESAAFVIENYYTSDGHAHSFADYVRHGKRFRETSVAVLLCERHEEVRMTGGWEVAPVVLYRDWIASIWASLPSQYGTKRPAQFWLLDQMHSYFVKGVTTVKEQQDLVDLMVVLAERGLDEAYRSPNGADAIVSALSKDLVESFAESRKLLQSVKARLKTYCDKVLVPTINAEFGEGHLQRREHDYAGIYQWTINLPSRADSRGTKGDAAAGVLQIKWGPSASHAVTRDPAWRGAWRSSIMPDYGALFLTFNGAITQSKVALVDVLAGLPATNAVLVGEVRDLLNSVSAVES